MTEAQANDTMTAADAPTPESLVVSSAAKKRAMAINDAYQSLEKMRRLNLELECQERGIHIHDDKDYEKCTTCLFESNEEQEGYSSYLPSLTKTKSKKAMPCLICGTPCCINHRSKGFWQESLVVCCDCESVFTMEFADDIMKDESLLKPSVERLVDLYDRTLLLLQYSVPFIPELCTKMMEEEKRQNRTTLGTSTVGVATGLVGAAAFVTPVGPPLLIGSLLFGTSATAVQVGSDARYFTLPAVQLANRILALYGMLESVLRIRHKLGTEAKVDGDAVSPDKNAKPQAAKKEETFLGKTTTRLMKTGVGRLVTSAALSGVFLIWDSRNLSNTVSAIREGSRSEKAERLQEIQEQISELPKTEQLDTELQSYLTILGTSDSS